MVLQIFLVASLMLCTNTFVNAGGFEGQEVLRRIEALEERDRKQQAQLETQQAELETLRQQNMATESEINELKDRDVQQTRRIEVLEKQERAMKEKIEKLMNGVHQTTTDNNNNNNNNTTGSQSNDEGIQSTSGNYRNHDNEGTSKNPKGKNRIRQVEGGTTIAFFATKSAHAPHLGQSQAIVFENAITNIGNGYHTSTGAFTVPVSGVYEFSATILSYKQAAHFAYVVNGKVISRMYADDISDYEATTMNAILTLTQGDDVTISNLDLDKHVYGDHFSSFSGFLLTENVIGSISSIVG